MARASHCTGSCRWLQRTPGVSCAEQRHRLFSPLMSSSFVGGGEGGGEGGSGVPSTLRFPTYAIHTWQSLHFSSRL